MYLAKSSRTIAAIYTMNFNAELGLLILGQSVGGVGGESQRVITWLGRSVSQIAQNPPFQRSYPESTADFFSLPESPIQSDGENEDSETESMEKRARRLYRSNQAALPESPEVRHRSQF
jgi:hypothetical protein